MQTQNADHDLHVRLRCTDFVHVLIHTFSQINQPGMNTGLHWNVLLWVPAAMLHYHLVIPIIRGLLKSSRMLYTFGKL